MDGMMMGWDACLKMGLRHVSVLDYSESRDDVIFCTEVNSNSKLSSFAGIVLVLRVNI